VPSVGRETSSAVTQKLRKKVGITGWQSQVRIAQNISSQDRNRPTLAWQFLHLYIVRPPG